MQAPHRYPVGIQSFEKIRTQGYLYVDKTDYIWNLIQAGGDYRFLSRPRRFGKTLLVSTLEAYFQGRKELFEGLAIEQLDGRDEWPAHPVLRLDLKDLTPADADELNRGLADLLAPYERLYGLVTDENIPTDTRLGRLIRIAAEKTNTQVVVLVDNYDAPLLAARDNAKLFEEVRWVLFVFYGELKTSAPFLDFVFITGRSRFGLMDPLLGGLNIILNVSLDSRFAGICGITSEEIDSQLGPDVAYLAERMGITPAECREQLRAMYDGYRFAKRSPEVYNPFSLVTALSNGKIDSYWFGSGTPTSLVNMLRSSGTTLPELEGIEADAASFDAPTEGMADPIPFMYQSGYLTIKGYDSLLRSYTLGIPNAEVADGLYVDFAG